MKNQRSEGVRLTQVDHLGHTSFAVSRGETRILIDPIVARKDLGFRDPSFPQWYFDDRNGYAAIFISHGHNDHLHPPSLLSFPIEVPFYFMNESPESCSCEIDEDPHHLLPSLGFKNYQAVDPGKFVELGDGIKVHFLPAQASSEGEEQCCFLIETPDLLMLDAVDIKDDPITRAALEPYRGKVDLAFLPTGQAVQWQGFWNQMDAVQALNFTEWLAPKKVATCGGTVSLHGRALPNTLERYPHDLADWLRVAQQRLPIDQIFTGRPPCRITFREHVLLQTSPVRPLERFKPGPQIDGLQPLLTAFFTGYHPMMPTRRLLWPDEPLDRWLAPLVEIRELVRASEKELGRLLERTNLAINHTPAKILAPTTLRRLLTAGEYGLAARLTTLIPPVPLEADDLLASFFAVAEASIGNADIGKELRNDLLHCAFIDRRMFQIFNLYLQLRRLASFTPEAAGNLRRRHFDELRTDFGRRRPVLGIHHIRLDRHQSKLLRGQELEQESVELLCYAGPAGVYQRPLNALEAWILDSCDGRPADQIAAGIATVLEHPESEVLQAMFEILTRLSNDSVLMVSWSE